MSEFRTNDPINRTTLHKPYSTDNIKFHQTKISDNILILLKSEKLKLTAYNTSRSYAYTTDTLLYEIAQLNELQVYQKFLLRDKSFQNAVRKYRRAFKHFGRENNYWK